VKLAKDFIRASLIWVIVFWCSVIFAQRDGMLQQPASYRQLLSAPGDIFEIPEIPQMPGTNRDSRNESDASSVFKPEIPQPETPQQILPQPEIPQSALPQPEIPQSTFPQPNLLLPGLPELNPSQPTLPQPNTPQPNIPQAKSPQPNGLPPAATTANNRAANAGLTPEAYEQDNGYMGPRVCAICGYGDVNPPMNYVNQGLRLWNRTRPNETAMVSSELVATTTSVGLDPRMSSREFDLNVSAGYVLTVGHYLGRDRENRDDYLEFTYFGMNSWQDTHSVGGNRLTAGGERFGSLFSPFLRGNSLYDSPIGGFNRADFQSIHYLSEDNNFELALRLDPRGRADRLVAQPNGSWLRECQPGRYLSYLFGIRYFMLNESYLFHSDGEIKAVNAQGQVTSTLGNVSGDYFVFSHNNLIGLDFGGDLTFRRCRSDWGVRGRIGPYVNYASQNSRIINDARVDPLNSINLDIDQSANHKEVSLIGELGFFVDYRLRPHMTLHGSWDFMWVTGLALAAEQLNFQPHPVAAVVTSGSICYQGITLQLDCRW
jgi:hypothetical protein